MATQQQKQNQPRLRSSSKELEFSELKEESGSIMDLGPRNFVKQTTTIDNYKKLLTKKNEEKKESSDE